MFTKNTQNITKQKILKMLQLTPFTGLIVTTTGDKSNIVHKQYLFNIILIHSYGKRIIYLPLYRLHGSILCIEDIEPILHYFD